MPIKIKCPRNTANANSPPSAAFHQKFILPIIRPRPEGQDISSNTGGHRQKKARQSLLEFTKKKVCINDSREDPQLPNIQNFAPTAPMLKERELKDINEAYDDIARQRRITATKQKVLLDVKTAPAAYFTTRPRHRHTRRGTRGGRKRISYVQNIPDRKVSFDEHARMRRYAPWQRTERVRHAITTPVLVNFDYKDKPRRKRRRQKRRDTTAGSGITIPPVLGGPRPTTLARSIDPSGEDTGSDAPLAPWPRLLDRAFLEELDERIANALEHPPKLGPPSDRKFPDHATLTVEQALQMKPATATYGGLRPVAHASLFTRSKPGKNEARLIVDARAANARDPGFIPMAPPTPTIGRIARFLTHARYATTADYRNYFYSFPLGKSVAALFWIPTLKRFFTRLPMGWTRAPDIAAATSAAIAGIPCIGGRYQPDLPTRDATGATVCIDNTLIGGPTKDAVIRRAGYTTRRAQRLGATFSQQFTPPTSRIRFYGVDWNLRDKTRALPPDKALKYRRRLILFARSRGPRDRQEWRAIAGIASWIGTVTGAEPMSRAHITAGLRAAEHRQRVVPGKTARREARRYADRALYVTQLNAPADTLPHITDPSSLSRKRHIFVSDAAVPGATAVVWFPPKKEPKLVHWSRNDPTTPILALELNGIALAAEAAKAREIANPILVTDARSAWNMVRKANARNTRHHTKIKAVLDGAAGGHLIWVPTSCNTADGPSRASSAARAKDSVRRITAGPLGGSPKLGEQKPLCFRIRCTAPPRPRPGVRSILRCG